MHHKTYGFLEISGGIDVNSLKNRIILKAKFGDDSYVKLYLQESKTQGDTKGGTSPPQGRI